MIRSIKDSSRDYVLQVSGVSWKKHFEDLFDYDQHSNDALVFFNQAIPAKQAFILVWRNKKTMELKLQTKRQLRKVKQEQLDPQIQFIFGAKATIKNKIFNLRLYQADEIIKQPVQENQTSSMFYNQHYVVVRSLKNSQKQPIGFQIKSNHFIKLGNYQFYVHLVCLDNQEDQSLQKMAYSLNLNRKVSTESFLKQVTFFVNSNQKIYDANLQNNPVQAECKYCMMSQSEQEDDFLCSPCKCSGSCGLVHFGCLVKWNKNKVKKTKKKSCVEYDFQKFFCEVCKQQYPQFIKKNQKICEILPMQKPKTDFIVIEALNNSKRHIIIVEELSEQGLVIGRGNDCGLRLDDPTISRRHALINKVNGKFVLYDMKSKFGTLVKEDEFHYQLFKDDKFSIQAGGTVLSFALAKKSNQTL